MRVCGTFSCCEDFRSRKQPAQTYSLPGQLFLAALLAIDDADRRFADEADLSQPLDGGDQGASGGHDVLDETDRLPLLEDAFDALARRVVLRSLADEQERQPRLERRSRGKRDCTQLGPGEANGGPGRGG